MNETERTVAQELEAEGWTVLRRGWPDFLAVRGKELKFIEVKPNPCDDDVSLLSPYQKDMRAALRSIGVHVWIMPGAVTELAELERDMERERSE